MSNELRIPKRRAEVDLILPFGGTRKVMFFLAEFAGNHAGHERLSDLMNGATEFLPAHDVESDSMTFISRTGIAAARVGQEWETRYELGEAEEQRVEIALADGTSLQGTLQYWMPPGRARLLDYLNDSQPFVRLEQGDKVVLVNKRHIARVAKVK